MAATARPGPASPTIRWAAARFYLHVALTAYRRQLVYRWANLAGLATNIFFGAIVSYVYIALFGARASTNGYDLRETLRYIWLVQASIMVVLPFGWFDLMLTIRTGEVVSDLAKPCDFVWYWFSREAGRDVYYVVFRALPTYAAGMLFFGIGAPTDGGTWLAFAVALTFAAAAGLAFRFLYNVIAFWVLETRSFGGFAQLLALFFGGSYVPVMFFPAWLKALVVWLPFGAMFNVPAQILDGKLTGTVLASALAGQVVWGIALTLACRAVTALAFRRVVAQGG
jgi:ABC-2 type transport system permease protein